MSRTRKRRDTAVFSLSFLDAISCGFGAIVLLLVIVQTAEPTIIRERGQGLENLAEQLADRLPELDARLAELERQLQEAQQARDAATQRVATLQPQATELAAARAAAELDSAAAAVIEQRLARARQELTEEMRRLLGADFRRRDDAVGGIPVDSEYIIFVIDTSGSMTQYAWPLVLQKVRETLDVYPRVRGIQVLSDMGDHMFPSYAGRWIPDTPERRRIIVDRLRTWHPFSNSSPVEGIVRAIRTYADPNKRISIYVFGDDFTGPSVQAVLDTVARINPRDAQGEPMVRIHGIGFPVLFLAGPQAQPGGYRFAHLMRTLSAANGGTYVGLPGLR
jgi:hypothetical protein